MGTKAIPWRLVGLPHVQVAWECLSVASVHLFLEFSRRHTSDVGCIPQYIMNVPPCGEGLLDESRRIVSRGSLFFLAVFERCRNEAQKERVGLSRA